jgi:hypothetical protein
MATDFDVLQSASLNQFGNSLLAYFPQAGCFGLRNPVGCVECLLLQIS